MASGHLSEGPVPADTTCCGLSRPLTYTEVDSIFGAIATASAGPGGLTRMQGNVVDAICLALNGRHFDATSAPGVSPADLAKVITVNGFPVVFRERIVRYMGLVSLLLNPLPSHVVDNIERYADALGLAGMCDAVVARVGTKRQDAMLTDFARNGYAREFVAQGYDRALHASTAEVGHGWGFADHDAELAERWQALEDCPTGSLGRDVFDFYRSRQFVVPGLPGSAPPLLAQHDWVHVLADYGTRVDCEIEVFALIAESDDDPAGFSLLAMILGLFETGTIDAAAGIFEADAGHLEDEAMAIRLADALRRGISATKPDGTRDGGLLTIDWFDYADRPTHEMRQRCRIPFKSGAALRAGSPSTWSLTGLSAYQMAHCDLTPFAEHRSIDSLSNL
jgi:hypothetical protein